MFRSIIPTLVFFGFVVSVAPNALAQNGALAESALAQQPCGEPMVAAAANGYVEPCRSAASTPAPARPIQPGMSWDKPILVSLQAATVAAQLLEAHATLRAMDSGLQVSGLMSEVVKSRLAYVGVKAAMGVGVAYATQRVARRSKVAAVMMGVAVNSAQLYVAHRNYKIAHSAGH